MEEIVSQTEGLLLYYDSENKLARAVWEGFLSGEKLHKAIYLSLDLIAEKKPENWLADNRKLRAIRQADQEWIAENLIPKLTVSSLQKMATLISEDIFNQMAVHNLLTKASGHILFDHQYFKSEEEAYEWLLK
jgi:hypothetical protein